MRIIDSITAAHNNILKTASETTTCSHDWSRMLPTPSGISHPALNLLNPLRLSLYLRLRNIETIHSSKAVKPHYGQEDQHHKTVEIIESTS